MLGESLTIDLFGEKSTIIDTSVRHNIKLFEPMIISFTESKERNIPTAKLRIELSNSSKDGGVGLFYLLVKGQVVEEKQKPKTISKQHSEDKFFKDPK